ncbi:MAG: alpha/beta hydrolase, partial [Pseudohongiellaceae bacterium]
QQFRIACHYFAVPVAQQTGTVFLLHGLYDHSGLYTHLIRSCLLDGRSVVIFDLPGHGLSTGRPASISSFQQYTACWHDSLRLAEKSGLKKPWSVIGQSTGAAVIINHLLQKNSSVNADFEKCILLAPLIRPRNWLPSLFGYYALYFFVNQTQRRFATNSHDQEFLNFIRNSDPLQSRVLCSDWVGALIEFQRQFTRAKPCLERIHILQGTEDTTVNWRFNLRKLEEKFPNSRTCIIRSSRHHMVNESAQYRTEILNTIGEICRSP